MFDPINNNNTIFGKCQYVHSRFHKFMKGGKTVENNIRERLRNIGKTQTWLILRLREQGLIVQTSEFSYILSGVLTTPKAKRVLQVCDEILVEYENEVGSNG